MSIIHKIVLLFFLSAMWCNVRAQEPLRAMSYAQRDSNALRKSRLFGHPADEQADIVDFGRSLLKKNSGHRLENNRHEPGKLHVSPLVAPTYTIQTGFGALVGSELAFYTDTNKDGNISSILTSINYTQKEQTIFPVETNIWTKNNTYNIQTDWRYLNYPSETFGLGGNSSLAGGYVIDYHYLRLHQSIFRGIARNTYVGVGFDFDNYWNIRELNGAEQDSLGGKTDYDQYGFRKTATASGITVGFLYDSRRNSINPDNGSYINISYRPKFTFMGSDANWQSLLVEFKHYQKFPENSQNVFALWSYNWLTIKGDPPYLLLPSTGWDPYWNTGRGYAQGRYRAKNMVYLETEYRFVILPNGLIGGVVFANAQSFSGKTSPELVSVVPGYGAGLRIKLNKFSRTNFCVDYGWGLPGNKGFALNIGEVF